jgi:hypothetical protein
VIVHGSALLASAPMLTVATAQDTAGTAAYAPKAGGPPDSTGYMWPATRSPRPPTVDISCCCCVVWRERSAGDDPPVIGR